MVQGGYEFIEVVPWEGASGTGAVVCSGIECTSEFIYEGISGSREIVVQYFDHLGGASGFELWVGDQRVDTWIGADDVPTRVVDSSSSARRTISGLALRTGDRIRIVGHPDGIENSALDYAEVR